MRSKGASPISTLQENNECDTLSFHCSYLSDFANPVEADVFTVSCYKLLQHIIGATDTAWFHSPSNNNGNSHVCCVLGPGVITMYYSILSKA